MKAKGFFLGLLALLGGFGGAEGLGDPMAGRLEREAEVLLRLFTEEVREEAFAPGFLAQVPAAQVAAIVARLKANLGEPEGRGPWSREGTSWSLSGGMCPPASAWTGRGASRASS